MPSGTDVEAMQRSFAQLVRALGLARPDTTPCGMPMSITEAHALGELHDDGPLTQQQLADRLRLKKSTISRLIDQLEGSGLVRRAPNPTDARSVLIELTTQGRRRAARLSAARAELFGEIVGRLTTAQRRQVVEALGLLEKATRARV